jgi:ribosomal protein S18 acetylase RimI-like enzyme
MQAGGLREVTDADFDQLMTWFPSAGALSTWSGPDFRFPFTRETFQEDCRWPGMQSRVLRANGELLAFGQFYERHGRINLARLVVNPARRGEGLGSRLVAALLDEAPAFVGGDEFSLYVLRDNAAALRCYRSAGFRVADYPEGDPWADTCFYMTRPVDRRN